MLIRPALAADLPEIVDLAFETFEAGYPLRPSRARVEATLPAILFGGGYLRVAERDGVVAGFLAGIRGNGSLWSDDVCAVEQLFVVAPEYRATRAAHMLLKDFIGWGRKTGCDAVCVTSQGALLNRVGRFYARYGFEPVETVFILRLS